LIEPPLQIHTAGAAGDTAALTEVHYMGGGKHQPPLQRALQGRSGNRSYRGTLCRNTLVRAADAAAPTVNFCSSVVFVNSLYHFPVTASPHLGGDSGEASLRITWWQTPCLRHASLGQLATPLSNDQVCLDADRGAENAGHGLD